VGDVLIGATQVVAEYNGADRASHVKDKIVEMNHLNETLYCGCIACASEGHREPSGTYLVDVLLANIHKHNVTRFPYQIARLAQDIAGGVLATTPAEVDWKDPRVGKYVDKYMKGVADIPAETRLRLIRLLEGMTCGTALVESMHGAGSPQAQRIMIERQANFERKKRLAQKLAKIGEQPLFVC
jgi:4-hydroxybutyryl-CoA dehydratase/vinylacetyl-CoA-Delta-isomerase